MGAQTPALLSAAHFTIFLEVMIMIQNTISQYVRTLFDESRDGELLAGDADNQFDYPVEWDMAASLNAFRLEGKDNKLPCLLQILCFHPGIHRLPAA